MIDYLVTPLISASIGYLTNKIAITMLFRPRKPFFGIQGLFIKRKADLADKLSEVIVERLIASGLDQVTGSRIENVITDVANDMSKTIIAGAGVSEQADLEPIVGNIIKEAIYKSIVLSDVSVSDSNSEHMREIIKSNFMAIDNDEFEALVRAIAGKEFFEIELIGAILGGLIGFINVMITN